MRHTRPTLALAAVMAALAAVAAPTPATAAAPPAASVVVAPAAVVRATAYLTSDPATWTNAQLAAQLTFACVSVADTAGALRWSRAGIGGITLLGGRPPANLAARLRTVRAVAPHGVAPFVASDEEGGAVQRLAPLIGRLPSARVMGTWSVRRIRTTASVYGRRMRALGVTMELGPVADLAVRGYYMNALGRAFSSSPARVAADVDAWRTGMVAAGEVPVLKHWPGHGQALNSHTGLAVVPPLSILASRDMIPFNSEFARGIPAVMVGHLTSRVLTERGVPASESPAALRYLRSRTGPATVIVTDSLSMAAASSALHISTPTAAVRALRAGADWAMDCSASPLPVAAAIRHAIDTGYLPRAQAVASARRIVALKVRAGLVR